MLIDRVSLPFRTCTATATCLIAGMLCLWTAGMASDERATAPASAAVLVSVSLLDMRRLAPAQFGDWEPAVPQQAK